MFGFNPLTPGHFAKKCLLKRVKPFLGRCLAKNNPYCPKRCLQVEHWTSFCSWCQITAFKVCACAKSKISSFTFCFLSSPLLLLFFPPFFFVGHLLGFLLVGKDFAKRSRIVFFLRKYQWVVGQDFHGISWSKLHGFLCLSLVFDWVALIWVWLERSHLPAQGSCQSCLGLLRLMTSQVVQGTWLKKGGYGRFRGQCVKSSNSKHFSLSKMPSSWRPNETTELCVTKYFTFQQIQEVNKSNCVCWYDLTAETLIRHH